MNTLFVVVGLLPGLCYFVFMVAGLGFGVIGPVRFLVERLLAPSWSELVFYALVLGGCALSATLSLSPDEMVTRRGAWRKAFGWIAVLLLIVNTPMSIFQLHRLLARAL